MNPQLITSAKQRMQLSLESLERDFASVRTGRANPGLVENLVVDAYGAKMKLQELASITAPEPSLIVVQPWDATITGTIASALRTSDLNINPVVEGSVIRLPIPPLTQERRQEMVRVVSKKAEEARIAIRSIRHDTLSELKKAKDNEEIGEDEQGTLEKQVQAAVEEMNAAIERMAKKKEEDLLKV